MKYLFPFDWTNTLRIPFFIANTSSVAFVSSTSLVRFYCYILPQKTLLNAILIIGVSSRWMILDNIYVGDLPGYTWRLVNLSWLQTCRLLAMPTHSNTTKTAQFLPREACFSSNVSICELHTTHTIFQPQNDDDSSLSFIPIPNNQLICSSTCLYFKCTSFVGSVWHLLLLSL